MAFRLLTNGISGDCSQQKLATNVPFFNAFVAFRLDFEAIS